MSTARCLAPCAPILLKPPQRALRPPVVTAKCIFARVDGSEKRGKATAPQQQGQRQLPVPLSRLLAGCSAAAASLFVPLLPSWPADSFDYLSDTYLDPNIAESPDILNTLLIVVVTYFTVMLLYLWLSSFLDEDLGQPSDSAGSSSSQRPPADQDMPPGYGTFLDAHVRSYVDPHAPGGHRQVTALQELGQAQPLDGENLEQLKGRLAAGAAEALEQQIRDCERLVRSKLLARKLGYMPARSSAASSSSGSGSGTSAGQQQSLQPSIADIDKLLSAAVLSGGGLSSRQHHEAVEALIDKELDNLLPAGGGAFHEDLIVRQAMRRVVGHLVMEESLLLLEGVEQGKRALEADGKISKSGSRNSWALW